MISESRRSRDCDNCVSFWYGPPSNRVVEADTLIPVKRNARRSRVAGMPDQAKPVTRPWRRFLRFSVRGLIVLVLVIGGGLGWLVRSARIQREAVAAIKSAGGLVFYDGKWIDGVHDSAATTWAPRWLVDLVGFDYFGRVTMVAIDSFSTAAKTKTSPVGDLASLQQSRTRESSFPGAVLAHLTGLPRLSVLKLSGHQVTDDELIHLEGLTNVSHLDLVSTRITGAGLVHLKALNRLSKLCIHDSPLTDDGLANLRKLKSLSSLSLVETPISDAVLANLTGLTNLSELNLRGAQVTDAGVRELQKALPGLKITR